MTSRRISATHSRGLSAILLALAAAACQDNTRPEPPGGDPALLTVQYVCGNGFDIQSRDPNAVTVHYVVNGTSEQGELLLPPRAEEGAGSTTRLVTLKEGSLQVSHQGETLSSVGNPRTACPDPAPSSDPQARLGEWTAPFPWPVVAVHLHLLPNGKVLSWGAVGAPQVWHPETGDFTAAISSTMLFCSGHAFLPDGRLLVTGGHISQDHGLPDANIFDPTTQAWNQVTPMSRGRWYPTSTTLSDGNILTLAGRDQDGDEVEVPEIWTGGGWRLLPGARRPLPYYPRMFVAPNGLVFYAGELRQTAYLDPAGSGQWTSGAASNYGRRDYGSAVMYRPGRVMIVGGSDPPDGAPTNTAETIDLDEAAPSWRYTDPMSYPRRQFNTTLLPDGQVLATGGTSAPGFSNPAGAVHAAEVWNPATEKWSVLGSNRVTRVYHSTTLLLPDGRILHAGSGDGAGLPRELTAELYSPPYLFHGPRPSVTGAPETIGYGEQFFVGTPDAGQVVRVTLVRLGSVTHGFDQNQRFLELPLQRTAGGLSVTAPGSGNLAPPGHYLLFVLNEVGVPSVGTTLRIL
jgi:galactose oxidase